MSHPSESEIDLAGGPASEYPPAACHPVRAAEPVAPDTARLGPGQRVAVAVLGLGLVSLLVLAVLLHPSNRGYGTHQQLGFPPCTSVVLFGRRCPACGMTTSWSHTVRGQLPSALRANVGGTLLALLTVAAAPWLLLSAARGRWLGGWVPSSTVAAWVLAGVMFIMLVDWGVGLVMGPL
jgi:hypothetical protein